MNAQQRIAAIEAANRALYGLMDLTMWWHDDARSLGVDASVRLEAISYLNRIEATIRTVITDMREGP